MATETLHFEDVASANVYIRVFNDAGQVLDFADDTFKAIASATTPYLAATAKADMAGTGRSGYVAALDLSKLNSTGDPKHFVAKFYKHSSSPANTDNPVSDGVDLWVQFSELTVVGGEPVYGFVTCSVTSTAGSTANITAFLLWRGALVTLGSATASITVREAGSGSDLFTVTQADKIGATAVINNRMELTKASPNFTADRQYAVSGTITVNSVALALQATQVTFG